MMRILIAPNAFKNSLDATGVADAICKGLLQSRLSCTISCFPVGDGGDGTGSLLLRHLKGEIIEVPAHDPLNRKITASFGLSARDQTAVIELANASGLRLLQQAEYSPLQTTTYGTGELIKQALDRKVKKIIICIGGSATVDGGTGLLRALGVQFFDRQGIELKELPGSLASLYKTGVTSMDRRLTETEITVICDVSNKLLGAAGAAAVFGPQKGASEKDIILLEKRLAQLRNVVFAETGQDINIVKHGGAAGGVAAGLHSFTGARLVNGIDYFLDITGFDAALQNADFIITGEGTIDAQTLQGKAPFGVARRAKEKGIPVIALAGKVPLYKDKELQKYFDILLPINHEAMDVQTAIQDTCDNLVRTGEVIGNLLSY